MGHAEDLNRRLKDQRLRDAATGGPRLFDRYGRPILIGCQIEFHSPLPITFEIADAKPDLRPEAKPGQWILTLATMFPLMTVNNQRMERISVVGYPQPVEAAGDGEGDAPGDPAASDAEAAAPESSIVLTDMDRTARETLHAALATEPSAAPPAAPPATLKLVESPAAPAEAEPATNETVF